MVNPLHKKRAEGMMVSATSSPLPIKKGLAIEHKAPRKI